MSYYYSTVMAKIGIKINKGEILVLKTIIKYFK